jgi:hypothetical protein
MHHAPAAPDRSLPPPSLLLLLLRYSSCCCCCGILPAASQLMRMYFVGVASSAPYEVDMSRVFSFDSSSLSMKRHDVITLGDADSITEPVLRIRYSQQGPNT